MTRQAPPLDPDKGRFVALLVLAFVTMTTLWVIVGIGVTEIAQTEAGAFDQQVSSWLASKRSSTLTDLAHWASLPADTWVKALVMVALAGLLRLTLYRWVEWTFLCSAVLLELCVYGASSRIVGRERPDVEQLASESAQSWPSGHVAAATAMYLGLAFIVYHRSQNRSLVMGAFAAAVAVVLAMCLARLYLGAHFLTDLVGGVLLGVTSLDVTRRIFGAAVCSTTDGRHDI